MSPTHLAAPPGPDALPLAYQTNPPVSRCAMRLVLVAAFLGWMFDGLEMGIFPLVARPALQQLLARPGRRSTRRRAVDGHRHRRCSCRRGGGGLVFGWLGDRIGRVAA